MSDHAVSQIFATIGASDSGKSYERMRWALEYFLPRPALGYLVCNLPFNVDEVASYFEDLANRGKSDVDGDDVRRRLVVLGRDNPVLRSLRKREWGDDDEPVHHPRELLNDVPMTAPCHVMLDEFHYYCARGDSQKWQRMWKEWFSTLRGGATRMELISQDWLQVPEAIHKVCISNIVIIGAKSRRDGVFDILWIDWYNLRAAITGRWRSAYWVREKVNIDGTDEVSRTKKRILHPDFFRFYQSNNAAEDASDGGRENVREGRIKEDWETLGRWRVIRNFVLTKWHHVVFAKLMLWTYLLLFCVLGGASSLLTYLIFGSPDPAPAVAVSKPGITVARAASAPVALSPTIGDIDVQLIDDGGVFYGSRYFAIGSAISFGSGDEVVSAVYPSDGYAVTAHGRRLQLSSGSVSSSVSGKPTGVLDRVRQFAIGSATADSSGGNAVTGSGGVGSVGHAAQGSGSVSGGSLRSERRGNVGIRSTAGVSQSASGNRVYSTSAGSSSGGGIRPADGGHRVSQADPEGRSRRIRHPRSSVVDPGGSVSGDSIPN